MRENFRSLKRQKVKGVKVTRKVKKPTSENFALTTAVEFQKRLGGGGGRCGARYVRGGGGQSVGLMGSKILEMTF